MRAAGSIRDRIRRVTLAAMVTSISTSSLAVGVDRIRDAGVSRVAGSVRLAPGGSALARLWLPAGPRPVRLTLLADGATLLGQVDVEAPAGAGPFFEVVVEAAYDGTAPRITGITDGTSNTLAVRDRSQGIIAILLGLPTPGGPRAPMATLQILGSEGQTPLMLPFVERDRS
jgi:hypothetical protein